MFFQREARVFLVVCFGILLFIVGCGGDVSERAGQPKAIQQEAEEAVCEDIEEEAVGEDVAEEVTERISEEAAEDLVVEEDEEPEKAGEAIQSRADLSLKFKAGDETSYRLTERATKAIHWEGDVPSQSQFKAGGNETKTEMIFTQRITKVNESGTAVARITIDKVQALTSKNNRVLMDFDSSKKHRTINALSRLPGKSYKILLSPEGEVLKVIGAGKIQEAAKHGTLASTKLASKLVDNMSIKNRHGRLEFPSAGEFKLQKGQQWSSVKSFNFGMMGSEVYERVYSIEEIKEDLGKVAATVSMEAIPSVKTSAELSGQKRSGGLSEMFDNTATYLGELEFDLDSGVINYYTEDLSVQWFMIMPDRKGSGKEPVVLQMNANREYDLEKLE